MTEAEGYLGGTVADGADNDDDWEASAARVDPVRTETNAVHADMWDRSGWDDEASTRQPVKDQVARHTSDEFAADNSVHLHQDIFQLLHQHEPRLVDAPTMREDLAVNHRLASKIQSLTELEHLRSFTRGDTVASTLALLSLDEAIATIIAEVDEEGGGGQAMRKALSDAADEAEGTEEMAAAYGVDAGQMQRMDFAERQELARKLSTSRLRKFAELIGKFRALQRAESRKVIPGDAEETTNVVLGDDLVRLHSSEFPNLASPELEALFWARYMERHLMVSDRRDVEKTAKGPVVVVCDESGSMEGDGEAWSKAFSLALADQARRSKRPFVYVGFASFNEQRVVDLTEPSLEKAMEMTEGFLNGGTDIHTALKVGFAQVERLSSPDKRADVVLITDGDDRKMNGGSKAVEEITALADKHSTTIFGVYVQTAYEDDPRAVAQMANYCTSVRSIADLTDATSMADIYRTVR